MKKNGGNSKQPEDDTLVGNLNRLVVGQESAIETIVPFIEMHQAGLAPDNRPLGVVMLLGSTGVGKTRCVEALAEVLHGSSKNVLKIDCGEFQMEHEVAKLIGAPPGYLGHRETQPMLSQAKINGVCSESSDISLILFDEIEKAAPSMVRLMLGILDKATLRLGDNSTVNFERCLIFMTTNLGAREIQRAITPDFGFECFVPKPAVSGNRELIHTAGVKATKRKFSPEFFNRIDACIAFETLSRESTLKIFEIEMTKHNRLVATRLGLRAFRIVITVAARDWIVDQGTSQEFGARELNRTIQRTVMQPIAAMVARGDVAPGVVVVGDLAAGGDNLTFSFRTVKPEYLAA